MEESGAHIHVINDFSEKISEQPAMLHKVSLTALNEAELWKNFKAGDKKAFSTIYHLYFNTLYTYGRKFAHEKELVKDCVQDLFFEIWDRRSKLSDTNSIKFYLLKAIRIKLLKELNKNNQTTGSEITDNYHFHIAFSYESELINEQLSIEQKDRLDHSLASLSKRQKEVIFLRYYNNLSCEEIASVLSINHQSVHNLIHRALKVLRENLVSLIFFVWLTSTY